jgi:hypothetical protein
MIALRGREVVLCKTIYSGGQVSKTRGNTVSHSATPSARPAVRGSAPRLDAMRPVEEIALTASLSGPATALQAMSSDVETRGLERRDRTRTAAVGTSYRAMDASIELFRATARLATAEADIACRGAGRTPEHRHLWGRGLVHRRRPHRCFGRRPGPSPASSSMLRSRKLTHSPRCEERPKPSTSSTSVTPISSSSGTRARSARAAETRAGAGQALKPATAPPPVPQRLITKVDERGGDPQ